MRKVWMKRIVMVGFLCAACAVRADIDITEDLTLTEDTDWRGQGRVTIAAGVTVALNGHSLALSDLAGEGTISSGGELVTNGSFENLTDTAGNWSYYYRDGAPQAVGWNWTSSGGNGPGQTAKGSPWLSVDPAEGGRACFMQGNHDIYQTISVSRSGTYLLSFAYIGRPGYSDLRIHVKIDGIGYGYVDCTETTFFQTKEIELELTEGDHELAFCGDSLDYVPAGHRCGCLDAISLRPHGEFPPAVLTLDIPEETELVNDSVTFAGNLKLVKVGEGTLTVAKPAQSYTGETEVRAGLLKAGLRETTWAGTVYGARSCVKVGEAATLDLAGTSNSPLEIQLDGGTVTNSVPSGQLPCIRTLTLTSDSTLAGADFGIIRQGWQSTALNLNGHTLNVGIEPDRELHMVTMTATGGGRIVVDGGGTLILGNLAGSFPVKAEGTALEIRDASIHTYAGDHDVGDYISLYTGDRNSESADSKLRVHGTFAPQTRWHSCELQDGATLDLREVSGVFTNSCAFAENNPEGVVAFASEATVTVDLRGRAPAFGEQLVNWLGSAPTGTTFVFDEVTAAKGVDPYISDAGLFYGMDETGGSAIAVAHWTGAGRPGDPADPANWACTNVAGKAVADALPGEGTLVGIAGALNLQAPAAESLPHSLAELGPCTLTADCDLRGLGPHVKLTGEIDLCGHTLQLAGYTGEGQFIDSTGPTGASILANGSFETFIGGLSSGNWTYFHKTRLDQATGWLSSSTRTGEGPGLAMGGSPWLGAAPTDGSYAAFLQGDCALTQTFSVPHTGMYLLSFDYAGRPGYNNLRVHIEFDGITMYHVDCLENAFTTQKVGIYLTAGTHTFTLRGESRTNENPHYRCGAVDNVSLRPLAPGELVFDLAADTHLSTAALMLDGNLKLVKRGAGTLTAAKTQPYLGGTRIDGGRLISGFYDAAFQGGAYGLGTCLEVATKGVFDMDGQANAPRLIVLSGGRIENTTPRGLHFNPSLINVVLKVDSKIEGRSFGLLVNEYGLTTLDLGGHTLTVTIAPSELFLFANTTITGGGRIVVQGGGKLLLNRSGYERDLTASDTIFQIEDVSMEVNPGTNVLGEYLSHYTGDEDITGEGSSLIVHRRFQPGTRWHSCELQDGAILDLNVCPGTWTPTCTFETSGTTGTATFAEDATITIDVHLRAVPKNAEEIITWGENPPPESVVFKLDEASKEAGRYLIRTETGYALGSGLILFVR